MPRMPDEAWKKTATMVFSLGCSMFGVFAALYLVLLVVVQYLVGEHNAPTARTAPQSLQDVLTAVPVVCFGYQVGVRLLLCVNVA